jgi:ferredoxin
MKPYLVPRRCPAQEDLCLAIRACPKGAVEYVEDEDEPLGGRIVFNHDTCEECGNCAAECCGQAIELR